VSARFRFGQGGCFFFGGGCAGAEGPACAFCICAGLTKAGAGGIWEGRGAYMADMAGREVVELALSSQGVVFCKAKGLEPEIGCHAKFPPDFYCL
jgi:hypothetical protein